MCDANIPAATYRADDEREMLSRISELPVQHEPRRTAER
jgi:hypothetical protein